MSYYIQLIYRDVNTYPCPNPDADLVNLSMYKGPLINKMFESIAIQSRPEKIVITVPAVHPTMLDHQ